jgi:multisubunit Na+/H+ antiporter MnhF subunit
VNLRGFGAMESSVKEEVEASISVDVFSVSAAMVGVCLTVIQLIQMNANQKANTIVDEILAFDSIVFMTACVVSFLALKSKRRSRFKKILENTSDGCFLLAISTMVVAITLVVYTFF